MYNANTSNGIIRSMFQKSEDLKFGLERERHTADIIQARTNKILIKSQYDKSVWDYYDTRQTFLFEIKNYRYSINKYAYEIIGVGKLISDNLILIFRHEDLDSEIYFIQHNKKLFEPFNKRYIGYTLCIDIPKHLLTKLDHNTFYKFKNCRGERNKVIELIKKDRELFTNYTELSMLDLHNKIIDTICEANNLI